MKGRILIVQFDSNMTGSAFSGLILANGLREAGWETIVAFGHEGPMVDKFEAELHEVRIVPHKNWIRTDRFFHFIKVISKEFQASKAFEALMAEVKPELVYINTSVSFAAARAARRLKKPIIWHLRELFSDVGGEMKVPFRFAAGIRFVLTSYAHQLIAISEAVAKNMLGNSANRAIIVPNAVDARFFDTSLDMKQARRSMGMPEDGYIIGVPGTLRPMKGHPFFFEAVVPLLKSRSDLSVVVTGGGESKYVQEVKDLVDALGIDSSVQFLGYIEDMPAFYRACNAVCIPSVAEPFGRTVIEAFSTGVPVVATAVGGINEIIDQEKNGLLVPYGDKAALVEALEKLINEKHLGALLSTRALEKARSHYHESAYKSQINEIVSRVQGAFDQQEPAIVA